jgi:succinate--hydroxymethylglutarate CoA-transferase
MLPISEKQNAPKFNILAEKVLGDPSLVTDPKFVTNDARVKNRTELVCIITNALMKHDRDHWLQCFTGLGIPFGPINDIEQTFQHPQAIARQVTVEVEHSRAGRIKLVAPAVSYNGQKMKVRLPPPWLSEHTEEVMEELGYSPEQMVDLRKREII